MKTITMLAVIVLAYSLTLGVCAAQAAAGAESFDFLLLDANARAVALSGAYTALATDSNALLYNPAGLSRLKNNEATFMHSQHVEGLTQEYMGFASRQGWGLNLNYLDFGGIARTTLSQKEGTGDSFGISDMALGAGYAYNPSDSFSLGAGVKYIRETIDNVAANGYALDLGALYFFHVVRGLACGVAVQNMGPDVTFQRNKEKLPFNLRGGLAYEFEVLGQQNTLAFDLTKTRTDKTRFAVGAETVFAKAVSLRAGYNTRNDAGIGVTAGVGWVLKNFSIDYAFAPFGDLGITHRVSFTLRWAGAGLGLAGRPVERLEQTKN